MGEWLLCIALYAAIFTIIFLACTPVYYAAYRTNWLARRFWRWQPGGALALVKLLGMFLPAALTGLSVYMICVEPASTKHITLTVLIVVQSFAWYLGMAIARSMSTTANR